MKKHLLKTMLTALILLMGGVNGAWADDYNVEVYACDYENDQTLFDFSGRGSFEKAEDPTDATNHVGKMVSASNAGNVAPGAFAFYNFSEQAKNAEKVDVSFDCFLPQVSGQIAISVGDASLRTSSLFTTKGAWSANNDGAIFSFRTERGKLNGSANENYCSINGVSYGSTTTLKAESFLGLWVSVMLNIDVKNKTLSYSLKKKADNSLIVQVDDAAFLSSLATACTQIDIQTGVNSVTTYIDNVSITTYTSANQKYADYTVKYQDNQGNQLKDDRIVNSVVGTNASLDEIDTSSFISGDDKWIYVSDDADGKTIAEDGSTVVTVTFREAEKWNYTVTSSIDGTTLPYTATGSVWEDQNVVTVPYPRYQANGTTLVEKKTNGNDLQQNVTVTNNGVTVDLPYTAVEGVDNLYLLSEAENLETTLQKNATTFTSRVSNGLIIHGAKGDLLTLPAGKYKFTLGTIGGDNSSHKVNYVVYKEATPTEEGAEHNADNIIIEGTCTGNNLTLFTSDEFEINEQTTISFTCSDPASNRGIDLVYVQKTGSSQLELLLADVKSRAQSAIEAANDLKNNSNGLSESQIATLDGYIAELEDVLNTEEATVDEVKVQTMNDNVDSITLEIAKLQHEATYNVFRARTELQRAIDIAKSVNTEGLTAEKIDAFNVIIAQCEDLLKNENTPVDRLTEAAEALEEEASQLQRLAQMVYSMAQQDLAILIDEAKRKVVEGKYGVERLNAVIAAAQAIFDDSEATYVSLQNAKSELRSAIDIFDEDNLRPAIPTFDHAAGDYIEPIEVTLECEDGATIYYTLDGNDPTENSTAYTTPITIRETTTVKAIVILDGLMSDVVTATYTFKSPFVQEKDNFGGAVVTSLSTFVPTGTSYTLELTGCEAGQNITVPGGYFSYTPIVGGTVRFVRNGGDEVYVYENGVYKVTIMASTPEEVAYPEIYQETDDAEHGTGIYSESNLFKNPGFETLGDQLADHQYKAVDWDCNGYTYSNRSRVRDNANLSRQEGSCTFMIHGYGNPAECLSQTLTGLNSFTPYKVQFFTWKHNNTCTYNVTIGTSAGDESLHSETITTPSNNNGKDQSFDFTTGDLTESNYVFAITRQTKDGIGNFDRMTMVAANRGVGITGATGATFLADSAYAPEGAYANGSMASLENPTATDVVTNGTFDNNADGWTTTTGASNKGIANNQTGAFTGNFWENWNSDSYMGKMYQEVTDVPNGTYKLNICAFVNKVDANKGQYVYANGNKSYVYTTTPTAYTVYTYVTNHTLEYGLEQSTAVANWMGIDNVSLEYCGADDVTVEGFKAIYEAMTNHLDDNDYANVTGSERKALQDAVAELTTTADGYATATFNIGYADGVFTAAKDAYDLFVALEELPYANQTKRPKITEETTANDLILALRAYYESNAMGEGIDGREDKTALIQNPKAENGTDKWTVTPEKGIKIESGEPWTDAAGSTDHMYFDSDKWNDNGWDITLSQKVTLPAGKYILSAMSRGAVGVEMTLLAGEIEKQLTCVGSTGNLFDRGWNVTTMSFLVMNEDEEVTIGVHGVSDQQYSWMSFSDFRLVRLGDVEGEYADAMALASDNEAVAVGKLRDAIDAFKAGGSVEILQSAIDQFNIDNADLEKDETAKVGTEQADWSGATGYYTGKMVTTATGEHVGLPEGFGANACKEGFVMQQTVAVDNGTYKVELYATSHNAWNGSNGGFATLTEDATDVAHVFVIGSKTLTAPITSRKNSGMSADEPQVFAFDQVEVSNGELTIGLAVDKSDMCEWQTVQIKSLTWFTTAKAAYAHDKQEMRALIAKAETLVADKYKTVGKEALSGAIEAANAALESNKLNISEFEAEIKSLEGAIDLFVNENLVPMDGFFFVQNVATGKYMAAGHDWGTRAIVNEVGLHMYLLSNADNTVTFNSNVSNGGDSHYLGINLYMDSNSHDWMIEQVGEDEYTIRDGSSFLGIDDDDNIVLKNVATTWKFIDWETRLETLNDATAENGVNATFCISDANFNRNDLLVNSWSIIADNYDSVKLSGGENTNNCAEAYHTSFTVSQIMYRLPAGVYKMTAQGFYRQDMNGEEVVVEDAPEFFIGDATAKVPVQTGSENNVNDASVSFSAGQYAIEPIEFVYNGEDGLTVGIKGTANFQRVFFDNFELEYFGFPIGDVNGDTKVTTADAVAVVNFALEIEKPTEKQKVAADVNKSGGITVSDAVAIVNIALNEELVTEARSTEADVNYLTMENSGIGLVNTTGFSAFQMDVTLSDGAVLSAARLTERAEGLILTSHQVGHNTWRIAALSLDGSTISGSEGALLNLDIAGQGSVSVSNVEFVDRAAHAYKLGFGTPTAISSLYNNKVDGEVYTVGGARSNSVKKGVNIVRQADGSVRKMLVK